MPTLKAIRCSSLKSGRHDTKCLERKKGTWEGGTHSNHHAKGGKGVPQMMNPGKKRKLPNKKFSVACRLQQAVLNLLEDFVYRSALVIAEWNKSKIYICVCLLFWWGKNLVSSVNHLSNVSSLFYLPPNIMSKYVIIKFFFLHGHIQFFLLINTGDDLGSFQNVFSLSIKLILFPFSSGEGEKALQMKIQIKILIIV